MNFSYFIMHHQVAAKIDEILKPIASILPVDGTINILNPVIATGEFPTNLCAIKLLTELVTNQSEQITDAHVDNVMPNIAKVELFHISITYLKSDINLIFFYSIQNNSGRTMHSLWLEKQLFFVLFDSMLYWVKIESNQNFRC